MQPQHAKGGYSRGSVTHVDDGEWQNRAVSDGGGQEEGREIS